MKKTTYIIIFLSLLSISSVDLFAQSYTNPGSHTFANLNSRGGNPNNKGTRCPNSALATSNSQVPINSATDNSSDPSTGNFTCITHNYSFIGSGVYGGSGVFESYPVYAAATGITNCNGEDLAIGQHPSFPNQIECRRWDDGKPMVNSNIVSYPDHNVWVNSNDTIVFGSLDVTADGPSGITGSIESGIQTTRYCWGSSCNLSTTSNGTPANLVVVNTQQNRVLRFRTWDKAGNRSGVTTVRVKIDKTLPQVQSLNHYDGWTNQTAQIVNFSFTDTGGSNLTRYTLQRRISTNNPSFSPFGGSWMDVSGHTNKSISGASSNGSYSYTGGNNRAYIYRIRVWDVAGNVSAWMSSGNVTKIDTTPPSIGDVTNSTPSNLLADASRTYTVSIGINGGAPIISLRYKKENTSDNSLSSNITDSSAPWSFNWDIRNVDNYRVSNGSRQYTYRITRICDEAGNCWTGNENYYHDVYANTTNITSSVPTNQLSGTIVADGSAKNIIVHLQDQYLNDIIPASGIGRTVDMEILADNELRRNQYDDGGSDSALYVGTNTTTMAINSTAQIDLNLRPSIDGKYTIPFYVYAPTNNVDPFVPGSASISSIRYDINRGTVIVSGDNPQNQTIPASSTTISATPLYTTAFSGDIVSYGFIEGAVQDLDISVLKANSTSTSNNSLRAEFGDVSGINNIPNSRYGFTINGATIWEGNGSWGNTTQLSSSLSTFNNNTTLMIQDGPVDSETFSYLASIVKYRIGGKTIIYPSDIIGKNNYHGTVGANNSYQEGIKIIGNTSSESIQELTTGQFTDDIRVLGKLTKSTFRKDIDKKAYSVIRTVTAKTSGSRILSITDMNASLWNASKYDVGNVTSEGTSLFGDTVLYFGNSNLVTIGGATNIEGQKTIVIENGDLYISGNIENTDNDGILGIIVINGDILINNTVTDIHATLYTNKSILSSTNGSNRLDGNTSAGILENQLYIYGSLFSENTIGGSRKTIPECPYFINSTCSQVIAQSYDLNYLRRYYMYDSNADGTPDTPSGVQSRASGQSGYEIFPVIIDYNPAIQQTPPPFFD